VGLPERSPGFQSRATATTKHIVSNPLDFAPWNEHGNELIERSVDALKAAPAMFRRQLFRFHVHPDADTGTGPTWVHVGLHDRTMLTGETKIIAACIPGVAKHGTGFSPPSRRMPVERPLEAANV